MSSATITSTTRLVLQKLREQGEKVGLLKIRLFRPFPTDPLREALKNAKKVAVIDRNFSFGASGIFAQELKAALCNFPSKPLVYGYIAGIGGRTPGPDFSIGGSVNAGETDPETPLDVARGVIVGR